MNNIYEELTETDKKIVDYINENKQNISKLSVSQLAQNADVSPASIVRFSRKLGYSGFGELKIEIEKSLITRSNDYSYIGNDCGTSINSVINSITYKTIETITQTTELNDFNIIEKAIKEIINAQNIYIFGVGGSSLVALDLQQKLFRINKRAIASLDSHTQQMSSLNLTKEDIAIGISYSGKSKEVIKSIQNAKYKGAKCISITKYGENDLNKMSDIKLFIPNIENNLREGAISSRIAMLTLIDIIYISMIQDDLDNAKLRLQESKETMAYLKV